MGGCVHERVTCSNVAANDFIRSTIIMGFCQCSRHEMCPPELEVPILLKASLKSFVESVAHCEISLEGRGYSSIGLISAGILSISFSVFFLDIFYGSRR